MSTLKLISPENKSRMKNIAKGILMPLLLFVTIVTTTFCCSFLLGRPFYLYQNQQNPLLESMQTRIHIGDERSYVQKTLNDAWYYSECTLSDLFFYGGNSSLEAQVLVVGYKNKEGVEVVYFIGQLENYVLHTYDDCKPSPTDAFNVP